MNLSYLISLKKILKKVRRQGKDKEKLDTVIYTLQQEKTLSQKYRDHELVGNWKGYREMPYCTGLVTDLQSVPEKR